MPKDDKDALFKLLADDKDAQLRQTRALLHAVIEAVGGVVVVTKSKIVDPPTYIHVEEDFADGAILVEVWRDGDNPPPKATNVEK